MEDRVSRVWCWRGPGEAARVTARSRMWSWYRKRQNCLERTGPGPVSCKFQMGGPQGHGHIVWRVRPVFLAWTLTDSVTTRWHLPPSLSAEPSVNIPFTRLFKLLIEILNSPELSTSLERAWGVPNMLSELWRILFYKVRKKLVFYVFSWLIPHLYLPSHDSWIISHGRERRVSYLSCGLFPRFSHVLISQISWKLLSSGPIDNQRLYFSQ